MAQCEYCGSRTGLHGFSFEWDNPDEREEVEDEDDS